MFTVEELQVKLSGDATGAIKALGVTQDGLKSVEKAASEATNAMKSYTERVLAYSTILKQFATTAVGVLTSIGAVKFFKESVANFRSMKETIDELWLAIVDNPSADINTLDNKAVDELTKSYEGFATQMQKVTNVTRETTLAILTELEAWETTGEAAEKAARAALALGKLTKFEAVGFVDAASFLGVKDTRPLEKLFPELKKITNQTERLAAANRLVEEGFKQLEAAAGTWEGKLIALENEYNDLKEKVGEATSAIADAAKVVAGGLWIGLKEALAGIGDIAKSTWLVISGQLLQAWTDADEDLADSTMLSWDSIKQTILDAMTVIKVAFANLGGIARIAIEVIQDLSVVVTETLGDAVKVAYRFIVDDTTSVWTVVRDTITGAVVAAGLVIHGFIKTVELAWEAVVFTVGRVTSAFTSAGEAGSSWASGFIQSGRDLAITIGIVSGAIAGAVISFKAIQVAIGITSFILTVLHVKQLASLAAWGLWSGAVLIAKGVLLLYNAQMVAYNFLIGLSTASALAATAAATGQATANTLVATSYATIAATMLSVVGTGALVVAGFAGITTAALGVFASGQGVIEALSGIDNASGPIPAITGMFREWGGILKEVADTAKKDLPLAWELLKAGASLAVSQVTAYFPPFWDYIETGFKHLWDLVKSQFIITMTQALFEFKTANAGLLTKLIPGLDFNEERKKVEAAANYSRQTALDLAREQFKGLKFVKPEDDNEDIATARERLEKVRQAIADFKPLDKDNWIARMVRGAIDPNDPGMLSKKLQEEAKKITEHFLTPQEKFDKRKKQLDELMQAGVEKGGISFETYERAIAAANKELIGLTHQVQRFNAAVIGSVEDRVRFKDYLDIFNQKALTAGLLPRPPKEAEWVAPAKTEEEKKENPPAPAELIKKMPTIVGLIDVTSSIQSGGMVPTTAAGGGQTEANLQLAGILETLRNIEKTNQMIANKAPIEVVEYDLS